MRRAFRLPLIRGLPVLAAAQLGAACAADPCTLEPAYGGDATDEVYKTLDDATDDAESSEDSATVEAPKAGQSYAPDKGAPTFSWTSPLKLALAPLRDPTLRGAADGPAQRWLDTLSNALVPRALAHEPPVTSDAYLVNVAVPGQKCPVQAVTTELEATLDDAAWGIVAAAAGKGDFSLTVISAYLEAGRITEGPFRSDTVKFKVK